MGSVNPSLAPRLSAPVPWLEETQSMFDFT